MITRFVPIGYQPEHSYETEPVAEKVAGGLHLDPRFGKGGLVNPNERIGSEARRIVRDAQQSKDAVRAYELVDAALGA